MMQSPSRFRALRIGWLFLILLQAASLCGQTEPKKQPNRPLTPPSGLPPGTGIPNYPKPEEKTDCCLPTTQERNRESLFLTPIGSLGDNYQLTVDIQDDYADILRTYINYIGSIYPCADRFVTRWTLRNLQTGQESQQWIYVDDGNPLIVNNPYTFTIPVVVNTPYVVHILTYFEPKGCEIARCEDTSTFVNFRIEVSPLASQTGPQLILLDGNRETGRVTLGRGKTSLRATKQRSSGLRRN